MSIPETLLAGFKRAPQSLGRVLVLGLGKSGKIATRYCLDLLGSRVDSVSVAAGPINADAQEFATEVEGRGATVLFDHFEIQGAYDLCIVSPGISEFSSFYLSAAAASAEIVSEVEFAWRESKIESCWIAVTGTNGKTTTTALISHLLNTCGLRSAAVGNIGDTCLEAVSNNSADIFVAELSSYQLASTVHFAPNVAVLLNITPDHLVWHRSHEAYVAAKFKIFANLASVPHAVCILDAVNDEVRKQVKRFRTMNAAERGFSYIPIGCADGLRASMRVACGSENAAYIADGALRVEFDGKINTFVPVSDLQIKGDHNASNALAAASAALALGADCTGICEGLSSFAALEHRVEPCGSIAGVLCYNDSKATNVDATLKALTSFSERDSIVLLGGDDKGTDLVQLVEAAQKHCKAVICFGAAGPRFFGAFAQSACPCKLAGNLESALDKALDIATAGDVIVLSPACASFDEFTCFEQRGESFKNMVAARTKTRGA